MTDTSNRSHPADQPRLTISEAVGGAKPTCQVEVSAASYDALLGWDEEASAEAYNAFALAHPMYGFTSRDLARRASLATADRVIDLCGGTGVTARAVLDLAPARARVLSLDKAAAMQRVGARTLTDPRLSWTTAAAEQLADHVPAGSADAVVCNSAIWKTDTRAVFPAVAQILRPGGRFVFNVGGGFAGVRHPDELSACSSPTLKALVHQVASRAYGYAPPPTTAAVMSPKLTLEAVTEQLAAAGLEVTEAAVIAQHSTMAERKAWLSLPVFAQPEGGGFTHAQRMEILDAAYALTTPDTPTVTSWLVVTAHHVKEFRDEY